MLTKKTSQSEALKLGKECKRCGSCCKFGTGFVLEEDITRISARLKLSKEEFVNKYTEPVTLFNKQIHKMKTTEKPYGKCVFFEGNCRIHEIKPLHCKIGNCSEYGEELSAWFMLNHLVNANDPESVRQWKIYLESGGKNIPGGELESIVPDKKVLKKIIDYEILK